MPVSLPGLGLNIAADTVGVSGGTEAIAGQVIPYVRIDAGSSGIPSPVTAASPLPVNVASLGGSQGGSTYYRNISLLATGISVYGGPTKIFGYHLFNTAASTRYFKVYDLATAPTVGTSTIALTIPVAASTAIYATFNPGIAFLNGLGIGATTALADNSVAPPSANDCIINLFYAGDPGWSALTAFTWSGWLTKWSV